MQKFLQYATIVGLLCLFGSRGVSAQNNTQNLIQCQDANSLMNLTTNFTGSWYESSRSPASALGCVALDLVSNATGLYLNLTMPTSANALNINQTLTYSLDFQAPNVTGQTSPMAGYSFSSSLGNVTVKVLSTDNTNYAIICGYTSNANSSFGAILTRQRPVSSATLTSYAVSVNSTYADFSNMTDLTQSSVCYESSAASHASALSFVFAIIYALFKFVN
ncbi:unnamed protein product [Ceratitis capitata]|uniref:(Mediterranean fruit fly) hypothetical protein n=1 Tax=Ceratitis capitata TaxID=7213 RepID=A0A811UEN1_CERCA|nr:unnamed protein product [Ceratitis capitata]